MCHFNIYATALSLSSFHCPAMLFATNVYNGSFGFASTWLLMLSIDYLFVYMYKTKNAFNQQYNNFYHSTLDFYYVSFCNIFFIVIEYQYKHSCCCFFLDYNLYSCHFWIVIVRYFSSLILSYYFLIVIINQVFILFPYQSGT